MPFRFEPNRTFDRDLLRDPAARIELSRALQHTADAVAQEARQLAHSDRVRDGIDSDVGENEDGDLVGRVNANYWTSGFEEFGTLHRPANAPLRRALEVVLSRGLF